MWHRAGRRFDVRPGEPRGRKADPRLLVALGWLVLAVLLILRSRSWLTVMLGVGGFTAPLLMWKWLDFHRSRRRGTGQLYHGAALIAPRYFSALGIRAAKTNVLTRVLRGYALSGNLTITDEQLRFRPVSCWRWAGYRYFTIDRRTLHGWATEEIHAAPSDRLLLDLPCGQQVIILCRCKADLRAAVNQTPTPETSAAV
jgi:hypothetical protein